MPIFIKMYCPFLEKIPTNIYTRISNLELMPSRDNRIYQERSSLFQGYFFKNFFRKFTRNKLYFRKKISL